jgi:hypothetical protein
MNEYLLYFFFTLTNIPLYFIIFQLIRDRQLLQNDMLSLYDQLLQEKSQRRYSDMEEGNSEESNSEQKCLEEVDGDEVVKQKSD